MPAARTVTGVGADLTDRMAVLAEAVTDLGHRAGLAAVGIADASVMEETRRHLVERKRGGLHGAMAFTYRNPDRSTDPARIVPGARSMVVGAWDYRDDGDPCGRPPDGLLDGPTDEQPPSPDPPGPSARVARYARADHYAQVRDALAPIAARLHAEGWQAKVVCDDNALVDRAAAYRAGIGWFGKNAMVLLPRTGSWCVLGAVVTDAPLPAAPSLRAHGSGCGRCHTCLDACPTGALVAPGVLDARRCLAWVLQAPGPIPAELREAVGDRIYGCDDCQECCPVNQVAARRRPRPVGVLAGSATAGDSGACPGPPPTAIPSVPVLALLAASDDELLARYGRWYIAGREPRYLRRNALVVLGNTGDGADPATVAALAGALGSDDPMIVEHAVWAARRLGRDDLSRSEV